MPAALEKWRTKTQYQRANGQFGFLGGVLKKTLTGLRHYRHKTHKAARHLDLSARGPIGKFPASTGNSLACEILAAVAIAYLAK